MAATIVRHRTRSDRLRAEQAEELRRLVVAFRALPGAAKAALVEASGREAARDARGGELHWGGRERSEVDVRHAEPDAEPHRCVVAARALEPTAEGGRA